MREFAYDFVYSLDLYVAVLYIALCENA